MASPAAPGVSSAPAPAPQAPTPATPEAPDRLPGVIPEDLTSDDQRTPRRLRPIAPQKTALERILEAENPAPAEAPAEPGEEAPQQPEEPEEPSEKFTFAGKEFASREAAEAYFLSQHGQQKKLHEVTSKLNTTTSQRDLAATRANEWKVRADQLEAENQALRQGRAPQPTHPVTAMQSPSAPVGQQEAQKAFEEAVDWEFVRELHETKGPEYANFYLMRSLRQFMTEYVTGQIAQATAPERERQAAMQQLHAAADLFDRVSSYRDDAGNPLMPELHDPAAQDQIARIYVGLGFDPRSDKPELGVHYAVMAYREWARNHAAPPSTAAPAAGVLQGVAQAQGAASHVLSGNGTPRPAPPGQTPELQLKKAIREAGTFIPGVGFAP